MFGGIIVTDDFLRQMGYPDADLQGTIVSLYDIGWYVLFSSLIDLMCYLASLVPWLPLLSGSTSGARNR